MAMCIFLSVLVPVFADTSDGLAVEVYDVEKNIISVSGNAPNDIFVTVVVLNPGYTLQDIDKIAETSDSEVIQYFGFAKSQSGKFEKKIEINTANGGVFTACASSGSTILTKEFQFYSYEVKSGYVSDVKGFTSVETAKKDLPEIFSTYSLDSHPLYEASQIGEIAKLVCSMNKSAKIQNPKEAEDFLLQVLLVNAYNFDNEKTFDITITVKGGEGTNYSAADDKTFTVTVNVYANAKVVTGDYLYDSSEIGYQNDSYTNCDTVECSLNELYEIISDHSGQPIEKVAANSDRDYWMTAVEAAEYGMIDKVLERTKK